jgi:hypothetical protein
MIKRILDFIWDLYPKEREPTPKWVQEELPFGEDWRNEVLHK